MKGMQRLVNRLDFHSDSTFILCLVEWRQDSLTT